MASLLELKEVWKVYRMGNVSVEALRGVSLTVGEGEFLCVIGPSGSGKTTLLNMISTIDKPTRGKVIYLNRVVSEMPESKLARFRLHNIGIVFQFFNLLPELTALENVALPAIAAGMPVREAYRRAAFLLEQVGLAHRASHKPPDLSGGEQQRVAVARALVNSPKLIVADEPTGSLDTASKRQVLSLLKQVNRQHNTTVIVASHDPLVQTYASRVIKLVDGVIAG